VNLSEQWTDSEKHTMMDGGWTRNTFPLGLWLPKPRTNDNKVIQMDVTSFTCKVWQLKIWKGNNFKAWVA
jgi:hypothetical protein